MTCKLLLENVLYHSCQLHKTSDFVTLLSSIENLSFLFTFELFLVVSLFPNIKICELYLERK